MHIHYILTPDSLGLRAYKYAEELFEKFQLGQGDEFYLLDQPLPSKVRAND